MKEPLNPHTSEVAQSSIFHRAFNRTVNFVMGKTVRERHQSPEIYHEELIDSAGIPESEWEFPDAVREESIYDGLPPSKEAFKEMMDRGDSLGIIRALETASRSFIARSEAATDEAIRELREMGVAEEEIEEALAHDGWELTQFGAKPIRGKHFENMEIEREQPLSPLSTPNMYKEKEIKINSTHSQPKINKTDSSTSSHPHTFTQIQE